MTSPANLQLGASRLENLTPEALQIFLSHDWIHFGDNPKSVSWLRALRKPHRPELYAQTTFREFRYAKGDPLPFNDGTLDHIFSEHFFEHLFFDEAVALFGECARVLKIGGSMRVVVPDADLRTYESPEPVGYPDKKMGFNDPRKHKTRWSVYMLTEALRFSGLAPDPLRFCDRDGRYIKRDIALMPYVQRHDSLIVDGHKRH